LEIRYCWSWLKNSLANGHPSTWSLLC